MRRYPFLSAWGAAIVLTVIVVVAPSRGPSGAKADPRAPSSTSPSPRVKPTDTPSSAQAGPPYTATVTSCGLAQPDSGAAVTASVSVTNHTSSNDSVFVDVGFFQAGKEFDDGSSVPVVAARVTYLDTVVSYTGPPGSGPISCKVLEVDG